MGPFLDQIGLTSRLERFLCLDFVYVTLKPFDPNFLILYCFELPDSRVFTEPEFLPTEKAPSTIFQFFVPFHSSVR
jgi:hypothetical protein